MALGSALDQAENCARALELAGVMIVGIDRDGRIQLFNREAEHATGYSRGEVMGKPFVDALGLDDGAGRLSQQLAALLSAKLQSEKIEACFRTRAGKLRDAIWSLSCAGDDDDGIALVATGRDVTDERANDERLRQNERLAAVGTLAAGLAHEIRNPLNGAQLHVAFLKRAIQRKSSEEQMLEATQVVGDEITRLANLVTEFLDFARPGPLVLKPTSLSESMQHACGLLAASAKAAGVDLICDLPSSDIELSVDPAKFTQILLNLLSNGIEAGGKTVRLRGRRGPRQVFIDVEDDGPGLVTPSAPIFDAFYSTKESGTGLGLAITHRIVKDHRGTIDLSSRPGRTSFHVALPLE